MKAACIPIKPLLSYFTISKNFSYSSALTCSLTDLKKVFESISSLDFILAFGLFFVEPVELLLLWWLEVEKVLNFCGF
jgi:hypothetical protein